MFRVIVPALFLCLCGCSKVRTINGELFLTGKDGRHVSLAGIEVAAYDLEACSAAMMGRSEELSKERNEANRLYEKVSKLVELLSSEARKAEVAKNAPGADQAKVEAAQQAARERERRAIELRKSTELWIKWLASAAPHFENLPARLGKSVKTDSVGRFALAIPKDKNVVVVAVVESSVTGDLETHFWIAKVATHEDHVTLSSKNETAAKLTGSTGAGDSLLKWTRPLKASLAGINIPELRASIERELDELSKAPAGLSL